MNPWEVLEIDYTTDSRKIKKAYAKKLKLIFPDEQPEEFQALKLAFDAALAIAKASDDGPATILIKDENILDSEVARQDQIDDQENGSIFDIPFSTQLQRIVAEKDYFYKLAYWEKLVEPINEWSIDEFMANSYSIQVFLVEHFTIIAKEIIHFLFHTFDLLELRDEIGQENYVYGDFTALRYKIYHVPPFSFAIAQDLDRNSREEYFNLRYSIYCMLESDADVHLIEKKIDRAKLIFSKDSDLSNLYVLTTLKIDHGNIKNQVILTKIENALLSTEEGQKNETTEFLRTYIQALKKSQARQVVQETITWKKAQLIIPQQLYYLLEGYVFFFQHKYVIAFEMWKKLPLQEIVYLEDSLKEMKKQLWRTHKQDYLYLQNEMKKRKQKEGKSSESSKIMFFCSLVLIVMFFIFAVFNNTGPNTVHRISKTKLLEQLSSSLEDEEDSYVEKDLNEELIERTFIEAFYLSNQLEQQKQFQIDYMEENVSIEAAAQLNAQPKFEQAVLSDFTIKKNKLTEYTIIYYRDEPINLLGINDYNQKIDKIYGEGWERIEQFTPVNFDDLDIPFSSLAERFIYIFYSTDNQLLKDIFKISFTYDNLLREQMTDFVPAKPYVNSSMSDFSFITKEKTDNDISEIVYIRYKDTPFCTLRFYPGDNEPKINGLVGDSWNFQGENSYTPLKVVDYEEAVKIFIRYILFSSEKQENLAKYDEYFSDNIRSLVNDRLSLDMSKDLINTDLYMDMEKSSDLKADEPTLFLRNGYEVSLVFTFDDLGRLDHVYGDGWEEGNKLEIEGTYTKYIKSTRFILEQ